MRKFLVAVSFIIAGALGYGALTTAYAIHKDMAKNYGLSGPHG